MVKQAVKPDVGKEEIKHRESNYPDFSKVLNKNPLCTSCNTPVKSMIINGKPLLHPFLDTLLCEKCYSFYGDGEFSVDEDGSDKYCRWCGQGGTLFLCSDCTAGFCKKCIKRNLPRSVLKDVEEEDWQCFCCQVQPLYDLRSLAWAALRYAENTKRKKKGVTKSAPPSDSDEDYVDASEKLKKKNKKSKKEKLSYENRAYKLAVSKQTEFLNDIKRICDVVNRKVDEVKTKKFSKRSIESFNVEAIEVNHNKILSIFETFKSSSESLEDKITKFLPEWNKALEVAKENDKKEEEELVENGKSKTSVANDSEDESPGDSKTKKKSVNKDSDEESQGDSKSSRRSKKSNKSVAKDTEEDSPRDSRTKKKFANKDSDEESQGDSKSRRSKKSVDKSMNDSDSGTKNTKKSKRALRKSSSDESEDDSKNKKTRKSNRSTESKKSKSKQDSEGSESEDEVRSKRKSEESSKESKSKKDSDDELKEDSKKDDSDKESTKSEVEEDKPKKLSLRKSEKQKKSNDGSDSDSDVGKVDTEESKGNKRRRSVSKDKTDERSTKHSKTDMTSDNDKDISD